MTGTEAPWSRGVPKLRAVVVGLQHFHVFQILDTLSTQIGVEIVGLAEEDDEVRNAAGRRYGVDTWQDYRTMLERVRADLAVVACENDLKAEVLVACSESRLHTFVDKPLCVDLGDLDRLTEAWPNSSRLLGSTIVGSHDSTASALRELVAERVGHLTQLVVFSQRRWAIPPSLGIRPAWNYERARHGGTIAVESVHDINAARWLFRDDIVALTAIGDRGDEAASHEVDRTYSLLMEMLDGGCALCCFSWLLPDSMPMHGVQIMTLVGTDGTMELRDAGGDLFVRCGAPPAEGASQLHGVVATRFASPALVDIALADAPAPIASFIAAIRSGDLSHLPPPSWLIETTRLALMARRSADSGSRLLV